MLRTLFTAVISTLEQTEMFLSFTSSWSTCCLCILAIVVYIYNIHMDGEQVDLLPATRNEGRTLSEIGMFCSEEMWNLSRVRHVACDSFL